MAALDAPRRRRAAAAVVGLPRRPRAPTRRASTGSTSTPCPTATPARTWPSRSESVCERARRRRRRPGRGVQGDQPRLADGGPGQLGRDPLPDPAGHRRRASRERRRRRRRQRWPRALAAAADAAYEAVMRPVEGTILTVVRESAEAAEAAARRRRRPGRRARGGPRPGRPTPSARTPEHAAGAERGRRGRRRRHRLPAPARRPAPRRRRARRCPSPPRSTGRCRRRRCTGHGEPARPRRHLPTCATRSCTSSRRPTTTIPAFKDVWAGIGDSIVVVGGDGIWNCHIHTDDIGAAIEAAIDSGRPRKIRVTDLLEQVEEERWVRDAADAGASTRCRRTCARRSPRAVVAVATGDGIRRIFHSLGVQGIVAGGQSMNPSTAELLEAVEAVPGRRGRDPAQQQEHHPGGRAGRRAHRPRPCGSCPPRGITEGFAALLAYDPEADGRRQRRGDGRRRRAAWWPARSPRRCATPAATSGPSPRATGSASPATGIRVVEPHARPTPPPGCSTSWSPTSHEIVTIIEGEGATRRRHPPHHRVAGRAPARASTAEVHHGGQPLYPYLFGIE